MTSLQLSFFVWCVYVCFFLDRHLGMTVPIINEIHLNKEGTELLQDVLTAYYLPEEFQPNPPLPLDPDVQIVERAPLQVITRWAMLHAYEGYVLGSRSFQIEQGWMDAISS